MSKKCAALLPIKLPIWIPHGERVYRVWVWLSTGTRRAGFRPRDFFNPDGNRFSLDSAVEAMRNADVQFIEFRLVVLDCDRASEMAVSLAIPATLVG